MYDRKYNGHEIHFEASGGLTNSSLVMQDFETNSYWGIMQGAAIAGAFKGTRLNELPLGEKLQWADWLKKHPDTMVLSVNGKEQGHDAYRDYFKSGKGFRDTEASDGRLNTKEPIFAFRFDEKNYAVNHKKVKGGFSIDTGNSRIFVYRRKDMSMFESTLAFVVTDGSFKKTDGMWQHDQSGCQFNPQTGTFEGGNSDCPARLENGFDTFWYNWSLNNPETELIK